MRPKDPYNIRHYHNIITFPSKEELNEIYNRTLQRIKDRAVRKKQVRELSEDKEEQER